MIKLALLSHEYREVPLERLSRLNDGLEQLEGLWGDDLSDGHDDYDEDDSDRPLEILTEDGEWQTYSGGEDEDDWVEDDLPMELDEGEVSIDADDTSSEGSESFPRGFVPGAWPSSNGETVHATTHDTPETNELSPIVRQDEDQTQSNGLGEPSWKRFDILPSAPVDHAFYNTPPCQPSRQFMSRLSKEYRALESSLPGVFHHFSD